MTSDIDPVIVETNRPRARFYEGGAQIDRFRSLPPGEDHTPEDWVASTTPVRGQDPAGLTVLPDGRLLREAIAGAPMSWLGGSHLARWGVDSMLLVKLLDAGQRLPVHAHPDDTFAAAQLASAHGKAEAWFILKPGVVHLGLRRDVDRAELARLVRDQNTASLLGLLNQVTVAEHDAVVVPPGTLHAIGRDVLLAEVQQPTDLSILLEWEGFAIDGWVEGHLGLGFDRALDAVDTRATRPEQLEQLVRRSAVDGPVFPAVADAWFRLDRVTTSAVFDAGFAVIIATDGSTVLMTSQGTLPLTQGQTAVVPAACGPVTMTTDGAVLVARPPAP
ncbi:MAG: class I mannose-6-phosphate isomerase [Propionibacterium sp.]|nr:class I mannose-6-phosphate isomerase [Propionibacterium sp.]